MLQLFLNEKLWLWHLWQTQSPARSGLRATRLSSLNCFSSLNSCCDSAEPFLNGDSRAVHDVTTVSRAEFFSNLSTLSDSAPKLVSTLRFLNLLFFYILARWILSPADTSFYCWSYLSKWCGLPVKSCLVLTFLHLLHSFLPLKL